MEKQSIKILIIGSGLSGLACAHHLVEGFKQQTTKDIQITILEARDVRCSHRFYPFFRIVALLLNTISYIFNLLSNRELEDAQLL